MAVLKLPNFTFRSGILTRKLKGRADLNLYREGVLVGENFLSETHGPANYRPGTEYIIHTRRNKIAHFIPFVFNDDEAYVLSFTDGYLRFFTDDGVVTETAETITAITQASPGVITIAGHPFADGDEIFIEGIVGMTELNGKYFLVANAGVNTFTLQDQDGNDIATTAYTAYVSDGTASRVYEILSPYAESELFQVKFAQKADLMYLAHPDHVPRKLIRAGATSWTLSTFVRTNDPFDQKEISAITQANPGQVTTTTNHGYSNGDSVLIESVVGMTEVNNTLFTATVVNPTAFTIGVDTTTYTAYASAGVVTSEGAVPAAVGLYGGRVFYGGGDNDPEFFNGSRSPELTTGATRYDDFTAGADADHAIAFPLSSQNNTADRIRFFVGTRQFLGIGTYGGMYKANGGSDSAPIAGNAVEVFPIDSFGVEDIMPVRFGTDILYVRRGSQIMSSFQYSLLNDGFTSEDENIQSDEVTYDGIVQLTYQQGRPDIVWAVTTDGRLLSLSYKRSEEVSGWMEHPIGGSGKVITIAGQPRPTNVDRLWVVVERTIDGYTRRYVEFVSTDARTPEREDFFTGTTAAAKVIDEQAFLDMLFEAQMRLNRLDSSLSLDTTQSTTITPAAITGSDIVFTAGASIFLATDTGRYIAIKHLVGGEVGIAKITEYTSPTQVKCTILQDFASTALIASGGWYFTQDEVSGLEHLEGEEVYVLEDGGVATTKTVSSGNITLDGQTRYVLVGKRYRGRLISMPLDIIFEGGMTVGRDKTINKFQFLFRNTLGTSYGIDSYDLQRITFRRGSDFTDRPPPLSNDSKEVPGFDGTDRLKSFVIIQEQPLPCTIQQVVAEMEAAFDG